MAKSSRNRPSWRIAMVASEGVPYAKTGGLGDVIGSLSSALSRRGHKVTLFLPFYPVVERVIPTPASIFHFQVEMGAERFPVDLREHRQQDGVRVLFIDQPDCFGRTGLYTDGSGADYADNDRRFALFSRAALEAIHQLELPIDLLHAHDWQTGLVPVYARTLFKDHPILGQARSVYTIHNIEFQGCFPQSRWPMTGLEDSLYTIDGLEFWGNWSMMKGGLQFADRITTVSPTYAIEIRTPEIGRGMDGVIRHRAHRLTGIVNGIDTELWNPQTDPHLARNYGLSNWREGKAECKRALQQRAGLSLQPDIPLVGMVGRITMQKGFDILGQIAKNLLNMPIQFAILGTGEPALEEMIRQFGACYPDRVWTHIAFDEVLAHQIYAASDWFLMPSRSEPCGLSQLYALRYGSVPIVHATGGLIDTVKDATPRELESGRANGFHFHEVTSAAVVGALARARDAFRAKNVWDKLVERGLQEDWSWSKSAEMYEQTYKQARNAPGL